jgi:glycosyltransferase involved in cell wall biosynthesis
LYRNYPEFNIPTVQNNSHKDNLKIVYAGLIGIAQGIEHICSKVNFPENIEFHIYGDGPCAKELKNIIKDKKQIYYHGSLDRELLHETLIEYDLTLIPLKNRIYGSVPSKIFEFSKLGLPILFFSDGEGADIVEKSQLGITQRIIDYKELEDKIELISKNEITLPTKQNVQKRALKEFDLENQFNEFEKFCFN